jgi:hypothetical protein
MADDEQTDTQDAPAGHAPDADTGGRAHTRLDEPHPAGDGARTDREVGGPRAEEGAEGEPGTPPGAHGDIPTKGFDSHR